ncbi:hypothetical protein PFISCL1PPCAC_28872, partial [Pristionchus fissidentatus]
TYTWLAWTSSSPSSRPFSVLHLLQLQLQQRAGVVEGVTMVVGRTGIFRVDGGELLNFLMPPPLPPLPDVPPPSTTEGVFRRDNKKSS